MRRSPRFCYWTAILPAGLALACVLVALAPIAAQSSTTQTTPQFGGAYAGLDGRRQALISDWVGRFRSLSRLEIEAGAFYDTYVRFSQKTTFDAVTHALMTTTLTDASGTSLGTALDLVERVDTVKGQVANARGDHQFRMYVGLKDGALDTLDRSQQFKRGTDNTVYHKGYPINYRQQGGTPSIQISVALDRRHADVDVDYRSSGFPAAIFNGHLTSANSDVRAGDNDTRHVNRWTGLENWWRSFFGIRLGPTPADSVVDSSLAIPTTPRVGRKDIDLMVHDFLTAWLIEGDVLAAMAYVSDRAYACMVQERDAAATFDRGMAPYQLMLRMREAHQALGPRVSLADTTVGVRFPRPELRVVRQPDHAQFVVYDVPDDVAASFDCASRLALGDSSRDRREYGNYYGATFYVKGHQPTTVALLWAKDGDYWKIVSWQTDADAADEGVPAPVVEAVPLQPPMATDPTLVAAARGFLERWLIQKDYDTAFNYLSPRSYACYNLTRNPADPAAASMSEAGRLIRASLERSGAALGDIRGLDAAIEGVEAVYPLARVMPHQQARAFTIIGLPDAFPRAADCDARSRGEAFSGDMAPQYGTAYGMLVRFKTRAGEAPVLRTLWQREDNTWRITVYDVEAP